MQARYFYLKYSNSGDLMFQCSNKPRVKVLHYKYVDYILENIVCKKTGKFDFNCYHKA